MTHPDHEINRKTWNKMVDLHVDHPDYLTQHVIDGGSSLKWIEKKLFGNVTGKTLLHLMCQFGLDTISWAREGAIVAGVDISDRSIEVANEVKAKAGVDAEFVRSDILDSKDAFGRKFDLVYQSYGTHCWLSDINKWAEIVAHHLKPGGTFVMVDGHPLEWPLFFDGNYFDKEPERDPNPTDYCETDTHLESPLVEWQHTLGSMITALARAGLRIVEVNEYSFYYYRQFEDWTPMGDGYWLPPDGHSKMPLMFSIKAEKPV